MILDEIAKLIDDNSTSKTVGTNLFKGFENPMAPDTSTFVHEYGGRAPEFTFGSSSPAWEIPRIQVVDRSTDYVAARKSAEFNYKLLMGQVNKTLKPSSGATGTRYLSIEPQQSPFYLGQDDNLRHRFVCNFECLKSLSS